MRDPRRVVLFGPLPPEWGGVAVFMCALSRAVAEHGVMTLAYAGTSAHAPPGTRFVNHRRLGHIWALLRLGRGSRVVESTHFHLEHPHWLLVPMWIVAKRLLRFEWVKFVHDGSLPARYREFGRFRRLLLRCALRHVDELAVCDETLRPFFKQVLGYPRPVGKVPVLITADPVGRPVDQTAELADVIAKFVEHQHKVVSIGCFIPSYGFDQLVEAVERLRAVRGVDIGVLLVDGTFVRDEEFRSAVMADRDWVNVAENVPNPTLRSVIAAGDVFVRPFEYESYGLSRVEAILSGVPAIVTDRGETRGMLTYSYGDVDALAARIDAVLTNGSGIDVAAWAEAYRREAADNMAECLRLVLGDREVDD